MVIWLSLAWAAAAADVKLDAMGACGHLYRNVTVVDSTATDVYFVHEGGLASMKLWDLEARLQRLFHYDPIVAAAANEQQATDDERYNQSIVSNMVAQAEQAALAAGRSAASSEDSLADPVSARSLIGKPAPEINGAKWLGEKPTLEGRLVLVTFWEPWSIPCRKYLPELDRLQKKFPGRLVVVGVTSESEAAIEDMPEPKLAFPSVLDPKAQIGAAAGVTSVPYVILVDFKGIVRYQGHPTAITEKKVEAMLPKPAD